MDFLEKNTPFSDWGYDERKVKSSEISNRITVILVVFVRARSLIKFNGRGFDKTLISNFYEFLKFIKTLFWQEIFEQFLSSAASDFFLFFKL